MSEEKALTIRQRPQITVSVWNVIESMAPVATAARMFGVTKEQAAIVMATGYELGLPLTTAFDVIYVSKDGRRVLRPKGALGLIRASGLLEQFDWTSDDKSATVTMKRRGEPAKSMTLTIKDAEKAGWKSTAWKTTPQNMLRWRLIGWLGDLLFGDVLLGLSIADDSYLPVEITPDGDVIDAQAEPLSRKPPEPASVETVATQAPSVPETPPESEPEEPPQAEATQTPTLADLVARFGVEAIMAENNNTPPASDADLVRIRDVLEAK